MHEITDPSTIGFRDAFKEKQVASIPLIQLHENIKGFSQELARINSRCSNLKNEITSLEKVLSSSTRRLFELQGGKRSRLLIIGTIIKYLSIFWNRNKWNTEKPFWDLYHHALAKLKSDLKTEQTAKISLKKQIHEQSEPIALTLENTIFNEDSIPLMFELEYLTRSFEDENGGLLQKKFINWIDQSKKFLLERPFHLSVHEAALKGIAASACFSSLERLIPSNTVLFESKLGTNKVILSPEGGVVLKKGGNNRSEEEERLIEDLSAHYSFDANVRSFRLSRARPNRKLKDESEIELIPLHSYATERKKHPIQFVFHNPPGLFKQLDNIKNKLSSNSDRLILEAGKRTLTHAHSHYIIKSLEIDYYIRLSDESKYIPITLSKLKYLILMDQIPAAASIAHKKDGNYILINLKNQNDPHADLNLFFLNRNVSLFYTPDLSDPDDQQAYDNCEKYRWSYVNDKGLTLVTNFADLHRSLLQKEDFKDIKPIEPTIAPRWPIMPGDYERAINVKWKIISDELIYLREDGMISNVENFQFKPFIYDLLTFKELAYFPLAMDTIMEQFSPDDEYYCVLTGLFQCLDLHQKNLGVAPQYNDQYEKFKDSTFYIDTFKLGIPLHMVNLNFLEKRINEETIIEYQENGITIKDHLKNLPDLLNSIKTFRWKLSVFDTDFSIADNNSLQNIDDSKMQTQSFIPIRSVLLQFDWKNKILSKEAIQRLEDCYKNILDVLAWMNRDDAPIRKRLSQETMAEIDQFLKPIIESYDISESRADNYTCTVDDLRDEFVKQLIDLSNSEMLLFWQRLQNELSKNNMGNDGTIDSEDYRKRIAKQFFPRMTIKQQEAFVERQLNLRNYLRIYDLISLSHLEGRELILEIVNYIKLPENPLTTQNKNNLLILLENVLHLTKEEIGSKANEIHHAICEATTPTYFNCMKAMYPLLADAYALYLMTVPKMKFTKEFRGHPQANLGFLAGAAIGYFNAPLEEAIEIAKTIFPKDSEKYKLAVAFEKRMLDVSFPSFFYSMS